MTRTYDRLRRESRNRSRTDVLDPANDGAKRALHAVALDLEPARPGLVVIHDHDLPPLAPTDQNLVKVSIELATIHSTTFTAAPGSC